MSRYDNQRSSIAQPETYLQTVSSTIVVLAKIVEGLAAIASIVGLISYLAPVITSLGGGAMRIDQLFGNALDTLYQQIPDLKEYITSMGSTFAVPGLLLILVSFVSLAGLVLTVIEMVSLITLRFSWRGAGLVKVIHWIYFGMNILSLIFWGYGVSLFIRNYSFFQRMSTEAKDALQAVTIIGVIIAVIILIIILLHICYHKDVALAMGTVGYEVSTGLKGKLRRTHLSGISVLFAIPYLLGIIILVFLYFYASSQTGTGIDLPVSAFAASLAFLFIYMLKYFAISFCNRNLKKH